jgi:hypothetical protein
MEKEKEDFGNLFLPIQEFGDNEDVLFRLPHLKKWSEFCDFGGTPDGELNRDKVFRYMNLLYSSGSKLINTHRHNLGARKEEAAIKAGFDLKKKGIRDQVQHDLFEVKNPKILKMIMRFLILQKNPLWSSIVTTEQCHAEYQLIIMDPLSPEDEKKRTDAAKNKAFLMAECDKMLIRLKGYYKDLFGDDDDLQEAYKNTDLMLTSPEEIATINRRF